MIAASVGCASGPPPARELGEGRAAAPAGASITASRTIVTPIDATSIEEIFTRARADFAERRFGEAARGFDRIGELDPGGPLTKEALFNAAAAHDELGDLEGAAARYQEVARRFSAEPVARDALVRAVRLLAYLERWAAAGRVAELLLGREAELSPIERVVAYGGKALSLLGSEEPETAQYFINKGRDVVDAAGLDRAGAVPRDLAQLYFALGELRRLRGERIRFEPLPQNFLQVLEQRCQLLLDAQSAYSDAMRAYDAHWSAMAGFRVGELYAKLHEELMRIPVPAGIGGDRAALFEGAMRLRYSVLLEKGLTMMDHTVRLAERTGERSEWTRRAGEAQKALQNAMRQEKEALARLPHSREELQRALDDLSRRKAR